MPYSAKVIDLNGSKVEVVTPDFQAAFDASLPESMYTSSDTDQFRECSKQLEQAIMSNPEMEKMFDEMQLEQIMNGDTPSGYVWHHGAYPGQMQLVDSWTHGKTRHTGGRYIWGGGTKMR